MNVTAMNATTADPNATSSSNVTASNTSAPSSPSTQAASTVTTTASTSKATTTASTSRATTTTSTTTQTTTQTTTPPATKCYTCQDILCQQQQVTTCPSNQPLCISTISQALSGDRTFSKGCATEAVCKDKWWMKTAGLADCFLMDNSPSGPPGMKLDACSFCCTGDRCNQNAIPDMSDIYQP